MNANHQNSPSRNGIIRALVEQGNISRLTDKIFEPKKGKGARYNRKQNKKVERDDN